MMTEAGRHHIVRSTTGNFTGLAERPINHLPQQCLDLSSHSVVRECPSARLALIRGAP